MQRAWIEDVHAKISDKLTRLSPRQSRSSIYRVHRHLRNVNEKAYDPEIVAIGPYHRKNERLKMMEDLKWHYLNLLIQERKLNTEKLVIAVGKLEEEARKCYAEPIDLSAADFIQMMVLDGCFIIHLVRQVSMETWRDKNSPIFQMGWMMNSLQRDLMLFENQIPFVVLLSLYELIEAPDQENRLIFLLLDFFSNLFPENEYKRKITQSSDGIKHLLHLIYASWSPQISIASFPKCPTGIEKSINIDEDKKETRKEKKWQFIQSAAKLKEANVKFEKRGSEFSLFEIEFKNGIMFLPPLTVEDRTESFFRNLIAYEQYFQDKQYSYVRDYVKFLDCLIDSSRDVEILRRCGIVDSWLGDDEVVANMINKLTDSVIVPRASSIYGGIFDAVKIHCDTSKNRWMAKLRHNYLHSPWGIISIIAAVVLLLLTLTQAVFSILQVVNQYRFRQ